MTLRELREELTCIIDFEGDFDLEIGFSIYDYIVRPEATQFRTVDGDILESGADIIAHQVNCRGVMGAGLARQIKEKYPTVFNQYQLVCKSSGGNPAKLLGTCMFSAIGDHGYDRFIASLFAQNRYGSDGKLYTDYGALRHALTDMRRAAAIRYRSIAIPYLMGCGLGGGDWEIVSGIIEEELAGLNVTYYRYTPEK